MIISASVPRQVYVPQSLSFKNKDGAQIPITPDATNGFSFACWWRPAVTNQDHAIFNWESTFDRNGISFRQNSGGALAIVGSNAAGTVFVLTNGSNEVARVWIHLAFTFNSSKAIKVYKNASQILSGSGTITTNGTLPYLGRRSFADSMNAWGVMKDIIFQNTATAWTTTQITELYKRGIVPSGATKWSLNNVLGDLNNGNTLTLQKANFVNTMMPDLSF